MLVVANMISVKRKRYLTALLALLMIAVFWNGFDFIDIPVSEAESEQHKSAYTQAHTLSTPENYRLAWTQDTAAPSNRQKIIERAKLRRDAFMLLMRENPAEALAKAISISDYVALPKEIKPFFERPFSARGDIDLLWETSLEECGDGAGCSKSHRACVHRNTVTVGDEKLQAYSETKRHLPALSNTTISGIRLGHQVVVSDQIVRPVSQEDFEAAASLFPDGLRHDRENSENAALIAGMLHTMGHASGFEDVEKVLQEARKNAVANRTSHEKIPYEWLAGDTGGDEGDVTEATPYQEDQIDVLFIRVDFSDLPFAPVSQTDLETTLASVDGHLNNYSYGKAGINYTVTSQLYRMPSTGADYATDSSAGDSVDGNDRIQIDARTLAAADYALFDYDVIAVFFPHLGGVPGSLITYGGRASVGGKRHWINGINSVGTVLHEFGHNYGLYHANYYHPEQELGSGNTPPDSLEYGDIFDEMGSGDSPEAHFSHLAKYYMQWMPDSKVAEATSDGIYTIYRFDHMNAISNPLLAVKVPMSGDVNYWIGYRQLYTSSTYNLSNAAYVVAENLASVRETSLIDMTPESTASEVTDRYDAGLPVGGTYFDSSVGVRFNALAKGGTSPNEWIQVQVIFDPCICVAEPYLEIDEQSGVAHVVVRRRSSGNGSVTVNYSTQDGSASAGSDYYSVSGSLTWEDGDTDDKTVIVPIRPDILADGGENFTFTLSGVVGGVLDQSADTTTVTLLDAGNKYTSYTPGYFNGTINALAALSDGKVLIGGSLSGDSNSGFLMRLNANGSVDNTFIQGSGVTGGAYGGYVYGITVQDDGKILVGGGFTSYSGTACNFIVRLNANGSVDTSFTTAIGTGADSPVWTTVVEASGHILVGGLFDNFNGTTANGLVRLEPSGVPAAALSLPFGYNATVYCMTAEPDGKIMVGGDFTVSNTHRDIIRLTSTGVKDTSFDAGTGAFYGNVYGILPLPDGKYFLGGSFTEYNGTDVGRCCRVNTDGSLDTSFMAPTFLGGLRAVARQPDGKIVVGGFFSSPGNRFERLTATGVVDSTFDQGAGLLGTVYAIAVADDGAIWAGGYTLPEHRPVRKFASGMSPYEIWAHAQFTAAEIQAGDSAADQDPDGDGIINLAEMAMGTNPTVANSDPIFGPAENEGITLHNIGGQDYLQLKLDKTSLAKGAWFVAQFSNDLNTWAPSSPTPATNTSYDVIEDSATHFIVRDKTPISTSNLRFGRILIKQPE